MQADEATIDKETFQFLLLALQDPQEESRRDERHFAYFKPDSMTKAS
jgi:hypothetical protein